MKKIILILLLVFSFQTQAQNTSGNLDYRLGIGISILGSHDILMYNFENELNYRISRVFTGSASLNFGKSPRNTSSGVTFFQVNMNMFYSPFKNNPGNDFRLGTGLSYYSVDEGIGSTDPNDPERVTNVTLLGHNKRKAMGINLIVENTFALTPRLLLGIKVFSQPYFNGDINSGVMLKLGLRLY